ncbi:hypothetical protein EG68_06378 [Paragonimus skrjabini miyazakii]|uniref:Uncharacterized protein n=1 Tax=Paragonimus skrjabini miyazakii TaxID=59628 RepID=A0A8S9YNR5_9TREM|nr:hypothetical protein EG68_06378 [Paragonimus skrjabini miyazakii]
MKVMLTKRSTLRPSMATCDPFRASCSHLVSARVGTPGLVVGKAEDMQSMDSGHGHSSSTENGILSSVDPPGSRTKLQTHLSTFRCTTPQTCGRGTVKSNCPKQPSEPQTPDSESPRGNVSVLCQRSGTLPLSVSGDTIASLMIAKSSTDLSNHRDNDIKAVVSATHSSHTTKTRQSVSWLDPEDYQTCSQPSQVTCMTSADPRHSPNCHLSTPGEMNESIEGTLVLFSPVDPLGYAQLVHSAQSATACERNSPKRSAYSAFPTSFV